MRQIPCLALVLFFFVPPSPCFAPLLHLWSNTLTYTCITTSSAPPFHFVHFSHPFRWIKPPQPQIQIWNHSPDLLRALWWKSWFRFSAQAINVTFNWAYGGKICFCLTSLIICTCTPSQSALPPSLSRIPPYWKVFARIIWQNIDFDPTVFPHHHCRAYRKKEILLLPM